jgi:hypothetical protein
MLLQTPQKQGTSCYNPAMSEQVSESPPPRRGGFLSGIPQETIFPPYWLPDAWPLPMDRPIEQHLQKL